MMTCGVFFYQFNTESFHFGIKNLLIIQENKTYDEVPSIGVVETFRQLAQHLE